MAVKHLRKLLLGAEATAGTEVDTTTYWRGEGVLDDIREVTFVAEDVGYLSGTDRTYTARLGGQLNMTDTPATFEQIGYILSAGVEQVASGTADGAGTGKIYEYRFPTTTARTIKTYTIEGGDDAGAEIMLYSFVSDFSLSGAAGEALMMSATWMGRDVATATFTATAELPTVEEILFSKGKLWIDDATGSIGSTTADNTFLSMNLSATTGWQPVFTADGQLYFSFHKSTMPEVLIDVTFEHDATSIASKADWKAETAQVLRMTWTGTALGTAGTAYTYKTLNIDVAGKWERFEPIGEQDGNDIVVGRFRARYNSDADLFCNITVVNELAALP